MRARALVGIALAASAAGAALPAQAGNNLKKRVQVGDNFYLPQKMKVRKGTVVAWKWPNDSGDIHDVKLRRGPRRAKRFWSDPAAVGYTYKRKLRVPGKYHIVCTLHEDMTMLIVVRRPRRG